VSTGSLALEDVRMPCSGARPWRGRSRPVSWRWPPTPRSVPLVSSQDPLAQLLRLAQPGCMDELLSQDRPAAPA
jgi:hypothetical protein